MNYTVFIIAYVFNELQCSSSSVMTTSNGNGGARSKRIQKTALDLDDDEDDDEDEEEEMDFYEEDDDEDDGVVGEDEQLEDILDNDLSWELEIARRKKRWRLREEELRAERNKNSESGMADEDRSLQQLYHDPITKNRQPKQVIFIKMSYMMGDSPCSYKQ